MQVPSEPQIKISEQSFSVWHFAPIQWPGQAQLLADFMGAALPVEGLEDDSKLDGGKIVRVPTSELDAPLVVLLELVLPPEHSPGALSTG